MTDYLLLKFATDAKINLIKEVRNYLSIGLKEAKDAVEEGIYFENTVAGVDRMVRTVNALRCSMMENGPNGHYVLPFVSEYVKPGARKEPIAG